MSKKLLIITEILLPLSVIPLLIFSKEVSYAALSGLKRAAIGIIPALFPFLVISSLISSGNAVEKMMKHMPLSKLFGLSDAFNPCIMLGYITGFSSGTKYTYNLYKSGRITSPEAQSSLGITANVSAVFVISVIGEGLLKNKKLGIKLYIINIVVSMITGVIINRMIFKGDNTSDKILVSSDAKPFSERLTNAVSSSMINCLNITGFIILFSILKEFVFMLPLNNTVKSVIVSFCDFTVGTSAALSLGGGIGIFLCGFSLGFGGILMILQIASITENSIPLKKTIVKKIIDGILCGTLSLILIGDKYEAVHTVISTDTSISVILITVLISVLLIISYMSYKNIKMS